jgi:hypothetical protein
MYNPSTALVFLNDTAWFHHWVRQCISVRFENEIMTLIYCTTNALESVLVDEGIGFCLVAVRDSEDILRARAGTSPFYAAETGVYADYLTGGVGGGGSRLGENRYGVVRLMFCQFKTNRIPQ